MLVAAKLDINQSSPAPRGSRGSDRGIEVAALMRSRGGRVGSVTEHECTARREHEGVECIGPCGPWSRYWFGSSRVREIVLMAPPPTHVTQSQERKLANHQFEP